MKLLFLIPAAILLAAIAAGMLYQALAARRDRRRMTTRGRFLQVQGRSVFVCERGPNAARVSTPTLVFESGMVASALNWYGIQQALSPYAPTFSYDRPGLGWSDPIPHPRTPVLLAHELHAILAAAGVPSPYVLVAHSYGAMIARCFSQQYPSELAGIVLIDPMRTEGWLPSNLPGRKIMLGGSNLMRRAIVPTWLGLTRIAAQSLLRPSSSRALLMHKLLGAPGRRSADRMTRELTKMPREVQPEVVAQWSLPSFFSTCAAYIRDIPASVAEMQQTPLIEHVPTLLLRPQSSPAASPGYAHATGPHARELVLEHTGHWIHLDQPAFVASLLHDFLTHIPAPHHHEPAHQLQTR